jgi:hypothetical protein
LVNGRTRMQKTTEKLPFSAFSEANGNDTIEDTDSIQNVKQILSLEKAL